MTLLTATRYGSMECLAGDSVVSRSLQRYGEWAQLEIDLLHALIRPGMTALDVGAFLGTHTLAMASMVGLQGIVHSFEPRAAIREVLRRNVERNSLTQVRLHECALGARGNRLDVPAIDLEHEANFGGLALGGHDAGGAAATETIAIERLDDIQIGPIDFIKLDAEGMEADVLAGAGLTLAHHRPLIFAECNDLERGRRTLAACTAMGYVVYGTLSPAFNPDNFRGEPDNIFGDGAEASLLAVPEEKLESLKEFLPSGLAPITSLDDLALLMLHKPQYPAEVLAACPAAAVLGMKYPSPMSRHLQDHITELQGALLAERIRASDSEHQAEAAAREAAAASRRIEEAEHGAALRAAGVVNTITEQLEQARAQANRYRRTSLLHWGERLRHKLRGGSR